MRQQQIDQEAETVTISIPQVRRVIAVVFILAVAIAAQTIHVGAAAAAAPPTCSSVLIKQYVQSQKPLSCVGKPRPGTTAVPFRCNSDSAVCVCDTTDDCENLANSGNCKGDIEFVPGGDEQAGACAWKFGESKVIPKKPKSK